MKRMTAVLLSMILISASLLMPKAAYGRDSTLAPAFEENPYYAGREVGFAELDERLAAPEAVLTDGYYTEGRRLYRLIKNNLISRKIQFDVPICVPSQIKTKAQALALTERLFTAATEDAFAEGSADGDYLRWAVSGFGYDAFTLENSGGGKYFYRVTMRYAYYDSAQQERAVSAAVKEMLRKLKPQQLSDWELLTAVYRYIADGAVYDEAAAANPAQHPLAFTAYGALIGGKCVCQGYCAAFYRVCRELGFTVRILSSAKNSGNHSWNLVELNGVGYFADLTWDDERFDSGEKNSRYFLVTLPALQAADSDAAEHTPDPLYYDSVDFNSRYREHFAAAAYPKTDRQLITNCRAVTAYRAGAAVPALKVAAPDGTLLAKGRDYTVTFDKKRTPGAVTMVLTGRGRYHGVSRRLCVNVRERAAEYSPKHREDAGV